ncbi:MAG: hypothetical protein ACXWPM_04360, partial [Bdellovibrionota bacterium]
MPADFLEYLKRSKRNKKLEEIAVASDRFLRYVRDPSDQQAFYRAYMELRKLLAELARDFGGLREPEPPRPSLPPPDAS